MSLPNQLTLLRILLTPIVALLLFSDARAALPASFIVFVIASLTDWYDGYTARKYGYVSTWGKFFDPLADKILITTVLVCFCVLGYFPSWMVAVIVVRDTLITTLRSYAIFKGTSIVTTYLAKAKTFMQMGVIYITYIYHLLAVWRPDGLAESFYTDFVSWQIIPFAMYGVVILTVVSGAVYIVNNRIYICRMAAGIRRIFQPSEH